MKFIKKHKYLVILIIFQSIIFNSWIFKNNIFTFGDAGVYTYETQKELLSNSLFIYISNSGFGAINIAASQNPLLFLFGVLANIGVNFVWSSKILLFIPIVFSVVISSYLLILKMTKSQIGAFVGALIYSYNPYFIITLTGALYISLAYALSPFILLSFIHLLEKNNITKNISFSFVLAIVGFIEFRILYINLWIVLFYFLFYLIIEKKFNFIIVRKSIKKIVISGCIFFLLNIFWILPIIMTGKLLHNEALDRGLFGDSYFDIISAFTVFHPWWTGNVPAIFIKQPVPFYYFLLPIFVLSGIIINNKNKNVLFISFLFVLGVFLTKQSAEPFGQAYLWLYQHVPGFNAFREASKFYIITALSSSILVGYFLSSLKNKFRDNHFKNILTYVFVFSISIIFLLNAKTVITQDIGTMFVPREFPTEYMELNEFINEQPDYFRILWFPTTSRFSIYTNTHPAISALNYIDGDLKQFVDFSLTGSNNFDKYLYSIFENERFDNFLDVASVKYVIVPSYLMWDDVPSPWKNPDNYENKLNKLSYLEKINVSKDILVYENINYKPHIYLTKRQEDMNENISFQKIEFNFVNPTEYKISLKNITKIEYLQFSEAYHPGWKIRLGNFNYFSALTKSGYFLPDNYHLKNNAGLNSFIIDPEYIKENYSKEYFHENEDGSIDIELTLYFIPQSMYYIGLIISCITLLFCLVSLGYFGYTTRERDYEKNGENNY